MKKIILIIVIMAVIGGVGYWYKSLNKQQEPGVKTSDPTVKVGMQVVENNALSDWLLRPRNIFCTVETDKGQVKIMAKNHIIRIEGLSYAFLAYAFNADQQNPADSYSLTDGDWMYIWSDKQGTKLNLKTIADTMSAEQRAAAPNYAWQDMVKSWEASGYKYDCQEKRMSDSLFVAPDDVQFNDLTANITAAQQAGTKIKNSATGSEVKMEDIEAEMEKQNK